MSATLPWWPSPPPTMSPMLRAEDQRHAVMDWRHQLGGLAGYDGPCPVPLASVLPKASKREQRLALGNDGVLRLTMTGVRHERDPERLNRSTTIWCNVSLSQMPPT